MAEYSNIKSGDIISCSRIQGVVISPVAHEDRKLIIPDTQLIIPDKHDFLCYAQNTHPNGNSFYNFRYLDKGSELNMRKNKSLFNISY